MDAPRLLGLVMQGVVEGLHVRAEMIMKMWTKCRMDKMSHGQNVAWTKCHRAVSFEDILYFVKCLLAGQQMEILHKAKTAMLRHHRKRRQFEALMALARRGAYNGARISCHELGHSALLWYQQNAGAFVKVTVVPRRGLYDGLTTPACGKSKCHGPRCGHASLCSLEAEQPKKSCSE
uniref:Peptidase_M1 domain-containing protein n=1 Tax=Globodera pallida TaxID=36090 RepID=A0A183CKY2_GLOPA